MLYIQLHNQYILLTKKPKLCLNAFSVLLGGKQDENKNTEAFKQFISYLKKNYILMQGVSSPDLTMHPWNTRAQWSDE